MIRIFWLFFTVSVYIGGDELERINNLIAEVKRLQSDYDACREELYKRIAQEAPSANELVLQEYQKRNFEAQERIKRLEERIKKLKTDEARQTRQSQKLKEQVRRQKTTIAALRKELQTLRRRLEKQARKKQSPSNKHKTARQNIVRSQERVRLALNRDGTVALQKEKRFIYTKAMTYKTRTKARIYADAFGNDVVEVWDAGTSFTSYVASPKRIKITGYFVDKKWTKATRSLWIDKNDAVLRR